MLYTFCIARLLRQIIIILIINIYFKQIFLIFFSQKYSCGEIHNNDTLHIHSHHPGHIRQLLSDPHSS